MKLVAMKSSRMSLSMPRSTFFRPGHWPQSLPSEFESGRTTGTNRRREAKEMSAARSNGSGYQKVVITLQPKQWPLRSTETDFHSSGFLDESFFRRARLVDKLKYIIDAVLVPTGVGHRNYAMILLFAPLG
jgi:hypothetical protein